MSQIRLRRDKYHGWRVYVRGCPDPLDRGRMMYRAERSRGWDRRVSLAVAVDVVWGGKRAFRYLIRRKYVAGSKP